MSLSDKQVSRTQSRSSQIVLLGTFVALILLLASGVIMYHYWSANQSGSDTLDTSSNEPEANALADRIVPDESMVDFASATRTTDVTEADLAEATALGAQVLQQPGEMIPVPPAMSPSNESATRTTDVTEADLAEATALGAQVLQQPGEMILVPPAMSPSNESATRTTDVTEADLAEATALGAQVLQQPGEMILVPPAMSPLQQ